MEVFRPVLPHLTWTVTPKRIWRLLWKFNIRITEQQIQSMTFQSLTKSVTSVFIMTTSLALQHSPRDIWWVPCSWRTTPLRPLPHHPCPSRSSLLQTTKPKDSSQRSLPVMGATPSGKHGSKNHVCWSWSFDMLESICAHSATPLDEILVWGRGNLKQLHLDMKYWRIKVSHQPLWIKFLCNLCVGDIGAS